MALTTRVTWQQVKDRAALKGDGGAVQAEATELLELARLKLGQALTGSFRTMPPEEVDRCILLLVKAYADQKRAPGGSAQVSPDDGNARSVPRDPLAVLRPTLAQYTGGFA